MGSTCATCGKREYILREVKNRKDSLGSPTRLQPTGPSQPSTKNQIEHDSKRKGTRMKGIKTHKISHHPSPSIEGITEASHAEIIDKPKSEEDIKMILAAFNNHFILRSLDEDSKFIIANDMKFYTVGPREIIFEQDKPGLCFYVLATGRLEVTINGQRKNLIYPGIGFGEYALIDNRARSATITTIEKSTLWAVDRNSFKEAVKRVNDINHLENKRFIDSVPLFNALTSHQKEALLAGLNTQKWHSGQKIVKEGDVGDLFYIIKEGLVSCSQNGIEVRQMSKGDFFGEQSLLYGSPRTATCTAISEVKLISIGSNSLVDVLGSSLQQILYRNTLRIACERSPVLRALSKEQKESIFDCMRVNSYQPGAVIVARGTTKGQRLWIVLRGAIRGPVGPIEKFGCIGDEFLDHPPEGEYMIDYLAEVDSDIADISRISIEDCIGGNFTKVTIYNEALSVLKQVHLLRGLSPEKFISLTQALKVIHYSDREAIVTQNNPGNSFFIIKSGKVNVFKDGMKLRTITKNDYFGERSVLFNDFRTATVTADGLVTCWVLEKDTFLSLIDEEIRQNLIERIELQDDTITVDDLIPIKSIGKGVFGNVFLVGHKTTNRLYALKTVSREKIEQWQIQKNLMLERQILLQVDHTMILKLVKTFKDPTRIYFLMEFVQGLDLFDVLRELQLVSDADAKYYIGALVVILEHLHERDILYRDLKPENIMIDHEGYPKLIDFGTSKILNGRSYTTVGTPHYMAPEIILGCGYSVTADWWSLGVILYEFIYGGVPFGEDENDAHAIYEKILEHKIFYPANIDPSLAAKPLIQQLLNKNPAARTGGSVDKLKSHKWFANFNWVSFI